MRSALLFLLLFGWLLPAPLSGPVEINDLGVVVNFGQNIHFAVQFTPATSVQKAYLFLRPDGAETLVQELKIADKEGRAEFDLVTAKTPLLAFSHVTYWYRVVQADGTPQDSNEASFLYEDTRFTWQRMHDGGFEANWVEGDLPFAQSALNVADIGLNKAKEILPGTLPSPVRMYIYPNARDMQSALRLGSLSWSAGHAYPDTGAIILTIAPNTQQRLEMERQIPHELMHLLQYQKLGEAYTRTPTWVLEGMASLAEATSNPDYQRSLDKATRANKLIPMASLCGPFPREASSAFLAYAEATSFMRFLHENYGRSGLDALLEKYRDGLGCEAGVQAALGAPLDEIEHRWKQETLGMDTRSLAWRNLLPYLLLLSALVLVPLAFGFWSKK